MGTMASDGDSEMPVVGRGALRYRPVPGWGQLPEGWDFVDVVGVATDSRACVRKFVPVTASV